MNKKSIETKEKINNKELQWNYHHVYVIVHEEF